MQTYEPIRTVCKPPQARNLKRGSFFFFSSLFFFLRFQSVISWACGKVTYHGRSVWQRETATSYARRQRKELEYHNPFGRHNHSDLRPNSPQHLTFITQSLQDTERPNCSRAHAWLHFYPLSDSFLSSPGWIAEGSMTLLCEPGNIAGGEQPDS